MAWQMAQMVYQTQKHRNFYFEIGSHTEDGTSVYWTQVEEFATILL